MFDSLLRVSPYPQYKWRIILNMRGSKKRRFTIGIGLFVGCLGVINIAQQRSTPPAPKARIEGTVINAAGNTPVAGVSLSVLQETERQTVTTDAQGRFAVTVPHGTVRLLASKDGYTGIQPEGHTRPAANGVLITVRAGQQLKGVALRVFPVGSVAGRVFDTRSRPVQFARTQLWRFTYDENGDRVLRPAGTGRGGETNDHGEFRIEAVDPGEYLLYVATPMLRERSPGESWIAVYYPGTPDERRALPVAVKSGSTTTVDDIALPSVRGGSLRIHMTNKTGEPMQSTLVKYLHWRSGDSAGNRVMVPLIIMGGAERAEIPVTPGHFEIVAGWARSNGVPIGFGSATADVSEGPVNVEVAVTKPQRLSGRVQLEQASGQAKPAGNVRCDVRNDAFGNSFATSAQDGAFAIENLPPARYRVECSSLPPDTYLLQIKQGERDVGKEGVTIGSADNPDLVVSLGGSGGQIDGTVADNAGSKVAAAVVVLVPDERATSQLFRTTTTDQNGAFALRAVAPGSYRVFAWPEVDGAAYKNQEFLKKFEEQATAVKVERSGKTTAAVKLQK